MQYLRQYRVGHIVYYTVYNSQGDLALITSSHRIASAIASSLERYPHCTEVSVRELDPHRVLKR